MLSWQGHSWFHFFFFLMIRRPPRSTQGVSSAASDVYKRQEYDSMNLIILQFDMMFYLHIVKDVTAKTSPCNIFNFKEIVRMLSDDSVVIFCLNVGALLKDHLQGIWISSDPLPIFKQGIATQRFAIAGSSIIRKLY
eukprot:TRINITY_DN2595_c0_g1_i4.p1 TRINITY_DN2595_c0_g1~~TRINITY_DN2595_c0_g1_i4.p1  ORF type:complete len:137 (-),score=10.82 TRINITY_DN2595_c0_g1_i4:229-639(-)